MVEALNLSKSNESDDTIRDDTISYLGERLARAGGFDELLRRIQSPDTLESIEAYHGLDGKVIDVQVKRSARYIADKWLNPFGTKSFPYTVEFSYLSKGDAVPHNHGVWLKILDDKLSDVSERFDTELAVLSESNNLSELHTSDGRVVNAFPYLFSVENEFYAENFMLLMERINEQTLEERIFEEIIQPDASGKVYWDEISDTLDPLIMLHNFMPIYLEKINERLMKSTGSSLKTINVGEYPENFFRMLESLSTGNLTFVKRNLDFSLRKELEKGLDEYSQGNGSKEATLIQHDGYPSHSTSRSLIDAGEVVIGPRSLHLGYLYGDPVVFTNLEDNKVAVRELLRKYIHLGKKYSSNGEMSSRLGEEKRHLVRIYDGGLDELERGFYSGAFKGAFRKAYGIHKNGNNSLTLNGTSSEAIRY